MTPLRSLGSGRLLTLLAMAVTLCPSTLAHATVTAANGEAPFKAHLSGTAAFTSPTTVEFHRVGIATRLSRIRNESVGGVCPMRGLDAPHSRGWVRDRCRRCLVPGCNRRETGRGDHVSRYRVE
jgi:hypothetical protein